MYMASLLSILAQEMPHTWQETFDDLGEGEIGQFEMLSDGNLIVAGGISVPGRASDAWVTKISPDGQVIWNQIFGGPARDEVNYIRVRDDNTILVGGLRDAQFIYGNVFFAAISANGELLWDVTLGPPHNNETNVSLSIVSELADGRIIAGGRSFPDRQAFFAMIAPSGEVLWELKSERDKGCLLYTSPSPRDQRGSRMPSSA